MLLLVRRHWLSIVIGSIVVSVVLGIEITGNLLGWPQPYSALFEYDSKTGFRNPDGKTIRIKSGERIYDLNFDTDGLLDRAGGEPAVIVIGDGTVAGVEVEPQQRISHLLVQGGALGSINLSVTGYGTLQQVLAFEEALLRMESVERSRTIVLIFNLANDLIDNIRDWEGAMIPGAYLKNPREILQPDIPALPYRIFRAIYLGSYTLQGLQYLFARHHATKSDTAIPCVGGSRLDCELALITAEEAFKRLHLLADKYSLRIFGFFWDHVEITPFPETEVAQLVRRIEELAPFVFWSGRLGLWAGGGNGRQGWFAAGTHHANAKATRVIVDRILNVLAVDDPSALSNRYHEMSRSDSQYRPPDALPDHRCHLC